MGWWGEQSFFMNVSAEQGVALVAMAESFFRGDEKDPWIFSERPHEQWVFAENYQIYDHDWIAEATRDRNLWDAGYPNRIVMTKRGARTLQNLLEVPMQDLPTQPLVGVVFPFRYSCEQLWQPLAFVFRRELMPNMPDKPWRLVTAVPYVANWAGPEWPGFGREDLDDCPCSLEHQLGRAYWPDEETIPPTAVIAVRDGCNIALRKHHPEMVTAFIYFAQYQLHITCDSVPNVDEFIEANFRPDWEQDFPVASCFDVDPARLEFWRKAFGMHETL